MPTYFLAGCVVFIALIFAMEEKCDSRARMDAKNSLAAVGLVVAWPLVLASFVKNGLPQCTQQTGKD